MKTMIQKAKTAMIALSETVAAVYDRRSFGSPTPPSRRSPSAATRRSQTAATAGLAALLALAMAGGLRADTITIDTVTVGDAGNAADPSDGASSIAGVQNYGAVSYTYNMGKYEVTLLQYTAFLNAVAATDTYSLYNTNMATDLNIAGISRAGSSGNYTYSLIGDGNRPVTYVNWFDAARFANWMHNDQPTGAQGAGTTEQGAYTLNGATSGVGFTKNVGTTWWIPSIDEWYKAAYYDQSLNGGTGGYWLYPTQSNTQPNSRNGSASDANSANYNYDDSIVNGYNGGYAVTNSASEISSQNYLTAAGAFTQAASYYGTFDQGGNVAEWNDEVLFGTSRGKRGGSWARDESYLWSSEQLYDGGATIENEEIGFRLATVPEPTTGLLLALGTAALALRRRRSTK